MNGSLIQKINSIGVLKSAKMQFELFPFENLFGVSSAQSAATFYGQILAGLCRNGQVSTLSSYVYSLLCQDENPLSLCLLSGKQPSKELLERAEKEYGFYKELCLFDYKGFFLSFESADESVVPDIKAGSLPPFSGLLRSYKENGCGVFSKSAAYYWNESEKEIEPLLSTSAVTLYDLKEYAEEKTAVIKNTEAFLRGAPANNVLLYGDRGTGKSSSVHALINRYKSDGLRLLEVPKAAIPDFKRIITKLADVNFKFIIFIDDLSFDEGESDYAALKAALEGSFAKTKNVLIYATSNRRHLIKESHSDRLAGDVHVSDTIEEQLSLSDRFGLILTYVNPSKKEYLEILKQILADRGLSLPENELETKAERYALKKGGRSPRGAKQLADMIESGLEF